MWNVFLLTLWGCIPQGRHWWCNLLADRSYPQPWRAEEQRVLSTATHTLTRLCVMYVCKRSLLFPFSATQTSAYIQWYCLKDTATPYGTAFSSLFMQKYMHINTNTKPLLCTTSRHNTVLILRGLVLGVCSFNHIHTQQGKWWVLSNIIRK